MCFPLRFELHSIWIWNDLDITYRCDGSAHMTAYVLCRTRTFSAWMAMILGQKYATSMTQVIYSFAFFVTHGFDGPGRWEWVLYPRWITVVWKYTVLAFHPPSVSLPLAVARWYILQVKCPKQRQQKEPQSDHERKIAKLQRCWLLDLVVFVKFWASIPRALEVGKPTRSFCDNQSIGWIYCGLGTLIQSFTCSLQITFLNLIKTGFELGPSPSNSIPVIRLCLQTSPTGILRGDEMNIYIYRL